MSEYIDRFTQGDTVKFLKDSEALHDVDLEELIQQYITDVVVRAAEAAAAEAAASETETILERLANMSLKQYKFSANVTAPDSEIYFTDADYIYYRTDLFEVYLNGLRAERNEYTIRGSEHTIFLTLTNQTFSGTVDLIITKLENDSE